MTRHALVVGINQYPFLQDTSTSKAKSLKTPAGDAEAIAQLLEADDNFRVERLPASEIDGKLQVDSKKTVTADELLDEITKLFIPKDGRDTALLFFAGHGLPKPLGSLKQILLATSDANPRGRKWNGVLLRDLWDIIEQSHVKEQIIWLDCCYSGELLGLKDSDLLGRISGRKRFLIAASHSSEVAYQRFDGKHGVLSGALIAGLDPYRMTQNKWITDRKLADFVEEELKAYYSEAKIPQAPQIRRSDGEIKLILGKDSSNVNKQTEPKESTTRKIPFVLPQLDVSTFTGRDEELSRLEELLLNRQGTKVCSIAGLAGVGGIGKSALACHFATIHKDDFPDGVIGLRVDGKDLDAIAREFARRCGEEIDSEDERDAATIMQEVFAHRRMLLIFDNAEDANIRALRPGGERCAVIITTRDHGLPISLDISSHGRINLSPLPDPDSLHLLEKLIGKERVAAEPEAVNDLIQLAGNLPLALQIIGAALKLNERRCLADYAASLTEERRLARLRIRGDEHLDLLACFSLSLKQLQPKEINFFACLSVCAEDGFSRQTAMAASGCDDEYTAQEYLDYLCQLSLLNYSKEGKNRFVFHPLIRLFAQNKAVELGVQEEAETRHAQFFIEFVKSSEVDRSVASVIAEEFDDIILAAKWLQKQETASKSEEQAKYEFAVCLQPFFERYGYWQQAVDFMAGFQQLAQSNEDWSSVIKFLIQQAKYLSLQGKWSSAEARLEPISAILSRIEEETTRQLSEAKWLTTLGGILTRQGRFDEAVDALQRATDIDEQLGNQEGLAMVLNSLSGVLRRQGRFDEAEDTIKRSYTISEKLNNQPSMGMVLHNLGKVRHEQGRLAEALATLWGSYAIFEDLDHQRSLLMVLTSIGRVLQEQGKLNEAIDAIQRSAAIEEQLGDKRNVSIKVNLLGSLFQEQGRLDEALEAFEQVVEISKALDDQRQVAIGFNGIGGILQKQDKLDEALKAFEQVVEISKALDDQRQVTFGLNGIGSILQKQDKLDEALEAFEQVVEIYKALDDQRQVTFALNTIGSILQKQDKLDEALKAFEQVVEISKALDDQRQVTFALNSIGSILQKQDKLDEALEAFEQVVEIYKALDDQRQVTFALNTIGSILQKQGKLDEALEAFEQVVEIYKALDDQRQVTFGLNSIGSILQKQDKLDEALKAFEQVVEISKALDDQRQATFGLNSIGSILQKQDKLDEALKAFEQVVEISKALDDQRQATFGLNSIGSILQKQDKLDEALKAFEQVVEISKALDDHQQEVIALHRISGVLEQQQKWHEAEMVLRRSYDSSQKIGDKRGQAIILNSLGQVLNRQEGTEKFELSLMYFRASIKLGEELENPAHLAKVYTAMGQALLRYGETEQAAIKLTQGFEIDENSRNLAGLGKVTPHLTYALVKLGRCEEAVAYCQRALAVAPNDHNLQELYNKLSSSQPIINPNALKQGSVKLIRYNAKQQFHWGYIIPIDGNADIYFREGFIDSACISQLTRGTLVEVEVKQTPKGLCARSIRIVDSFDSFTS